jgi:Flp pilus assembly protein TadG
MMKRPSLREANARLGFMQRILPDRAAGVALMFAISVVPVIGVVGIAIDLSFATQARVLLSSAADAAALAAVKTAADAFEAGKRNYIELGESAGGQWFESQSSPTAHLDTETPTVVLTRSDAAFSSTITYRGSVPTAFARLFGVSAISVSGSSSAMITTTAYVSITFLLDNSSSMLLAATQAGVDLMNSITPSQQSALAVPNGLGGVPCAFACHWDPNGHDYYGLARKNKVLLRFDVLQSAVQLAIAEMIREEVIADQFGINIYTFTDDLTKVYPRDTNQSTSADLSGGITAAQAIKTPSTPYRANTDFPKIIARLANASTPTGDGSSRADPRKVLIIVTDGLADYGSRQIPSNRGPIDPANCTAMKDLGFIVYLLYTPYLPGPLLLPSDNTALLPYIHGPENSAVIAALRSCASFPANFAQASDTAQIVTVVGQMLQAAQRGGARLSR